MIRECLPTQKTYQLTKMLKTLEKVLDIYFPGLMALDYT
jgi:hypothetical protein